MARRRRRSGGAAAPPPAQAPRTGVRTRGGGAPAPPPNPAPPAPKPAPAPAAQPPKPAPPAKPQPPPDPRDAQYWLERAKLFEQQQRQLQQLQQQDVLDRAQVDEALRRARERYGQQAQATTRQFNRAGLFYSGQLGQALGDLERERVRYESDTQAQLAQRSAARQELLTRLRGALEKGSVLGDEDLLWRAFERAASRATQNPPEVPPSKEDITHFGEPGYGANPKTGEEYKVGRVGKDVIHIYANRIVGLGKGKNAVRVIGKGVDQRTGERYARVVLPGGRRARVYRSGRVVYGRKTASSRGRR